jgi:hypothetical protein
MRTIMRWTAISISGLGLVGGCVTGGPDDGVETLEATAGAVSACHTGDDCGGPGDDIPPGPNPYPPAQPKPPLPYGTPLRFGYTGLPGLAFGIDAAITTRLSAPLPPDNVPWPLPAIPYVPEIASAPVRVESVDTNLWAFTSYDAGGMAMLCVGTCSSPPAILFNPNYGTYQATLRINPRLDIEFWEVATSRTAAGTLVKYPHLVAEVTATIETRAFAECVGWEKGSGHLHATAGADDVTLARDTGILEDIADFFMPGYSDAINRKIRDKIMSTVGVGHYESLPMDGGPCATLGVSGDAFSGVFTWNEAPAIVRFPVGTPITTKTVSF